MKALLIGGTRFIGHHTAERLLADGWDVTLLHRGSTPSAFAGRLREAFGDRSTESGWDALGRGSWDLAVDLCAYAPSETALAIRRLEGRVGRFLHVGTGQVYLILDPVPIPAREPDDRGRRVPEPPAGPDRDAWRYGVDKRACEELLLEARGRGFPATILRLPVVQGPRDAKRRLHAYVRRILDGGPLLLPEEGRRKVRYLYVKDFAALAAGLGRRAAPSPIYNLAMDDEDVTLRAFLEELARTLRKPARVVPVQEERLRDAGLEPEALSPLSGTWVSYLDPSLAERELGFAPTPWKEWLAETARWFAGLQDDPPGYERRERELRLA